MRCERFSLDVALDGDAAGIATLLRDLVPAPEGVQETVAAILADVRTRGDEAVLEYTQRFDTGTAPGPPRVTVEELDAAIAGLGRAVREGLERAIENVGAVAAAGSPAEQQSVDFPAHRVLVRRAPVSRAAVYAPGGRAPYPSTVVMGVVPARVAGVREIVVCTPPGVDGEIDATLLAACRLTGVTAVYRIGGAQAIAALAYGTESIRAADVIVGPGNVYVQEAKRQLSGRVGIDGFAGPSDLLVLAAADADPAPVVLDLLAQAEHGPGTLVVAASDSERLLDRLAAELEVGEDTGAVAAHVRFVGVEQGLELAEEFAPEHLQLVGSDYEALAARVTRPGCLFVGAAAATAFGDYIAGSNHILPTGGASRFASGVSPEHFLRRFAEVRIDDADELARAAAPVARAEGFELHARSMEARIRDNAS